MPLFVLLLLAMAASCGSTGVAPADDPTLRILFIGNSLTYTNDLPALVGRMGREDPSRDIVVRTVAYGDHSLEDHWNRGDAQRAIASARWDLVVLQQGPSALPESRALLVEYATRFAGEIRKVGARPAIYMVWPLADRADAARGRHRPASGAGDHARGRGGPGDRTVRYSVGQGASPHLPSRPRGDFIQSSPVTFPKMRHGCGTSSPCLR